MSILSYLTDFLFPKRPKVLELEALSSAKLLDILPSAEALREKDVVTLFDYRHKLVKELIWQVKYNGNRALATKLGEVLYDVIISELHERNVFEKFENVVLIPMPISDKRRFERGWNQAELLTHAIKRCDHTEQFKYLEKQLVKIRDTDSQKTLSKSARLKNLDKSMKVRDILSVRDQCVVVVDDIVTTGGTFVEARRALKDAGAKNILCVAVAH